MAIIENAKYNSLPEQVEENKDNIKRINEILENIDTEQVATILSDIQALKAEQVTQNLAIGSNASNITANTTAINNEKTERESVVGVNVAGNTYLKTATANKQILINNNGHIGITSNNNNVEIIAPNDHVRISTDNSSVMTDEVNGVSLSTNDSDVPNIVTLRPNGEFEVSNDHTLKFDTTGALTIDGQPIGGGGGGSQLYQHTIRLQSSTLFSKLVIISQDNTPIIIKNALMNYLYSKGFNSLVNAFALTGYETKNTSQGPAFGVYSSNGSDLYIGLYKASSQELTTENITNEAPLFVSDIVITL